MMCECDGTRCINYERSITSATEANFEHLLIFILFLFAIPIFPDRLCNFEWRIWLGLYINIIAWVHLLRIHRRSFMQ